MSRSALKSRLVVACLALALQALSAPFLAAQDSRGPLGTTIIRDVMVPMRDGVGLATDIYLPTRNGAPLEDPLPTILRSGRRGTEKDGGGRRARST